METGPQLAFKIDHFFKFFTHLKERYSLGGNLYNLTRFRVTTLVAAIASVHKRTETSNFNTIIFFQGIGHHIENKVHHNFRLFVL